MLVVSAQFGISHRVFKVVTMCMWPFISQSVMADVCCSISRILRNTQDSKEGFKMYSHMEHPNFM